MSKKVSIIISVILFVILAVLLVCEKMNPGADKLLVISKALGVSVEELLEDTDTFQKKTVEEIDVEKTKDEEILAQYHSFTTGQKRHLLEYMKRLGEEYAEEK